MTHTFLRFLFGSLFFFVLASIDSAHAEETGQTLILTKGQGGDAHGADILKAKWPQGQPELINLSDSHDLPDKSTYTCVIVVGQGAVDEFIQRDFYQQMYGKKIGIYTHLIDDSLMHFLEKESAPSLTMFFTSSQLRLLRYRDLKLYRKLKSSEKPKLWTAPLAIKSSKDMPENNTAAAREMLNFDTIIWLGGHYSNASGKSKILDDQMILDSLRNIHDTLKVGDAVAVMLMPRLFKKDESRADKLALLDKLKAIFSDDVLSLYASEKMTTALPGSGIKAQPLDYPVLMNLPWTEKTKHFVSADQYNLFTDLKSKWVEPFLLDPTDADQVLYAEDFIHKTGNQSMDENIWKHGCE